MPESRAASASYAREEVVGQHDRARRHRLRDRSTLSGLHHVARRGRQAEGRRQRDELAAQLPFNRKLLWLPVRAVGHLEPARRQFERRENLAGGVILMLLEVRDTSTDLGADAHAFQDHGESGRTIADGPLRGRRRPPTL